MHSGNLEELFRGDIECHNRVVIRDAGQALAITCETDALDSVFVVGVLLKLFLGC